MLRYFVILFISLSLSACVDRTVSEVVPGAVNIGKPETIFASTTRAREADGSYGFRRGETLRFWKRRFLFHPRILRVRSASPTRTRIRGKNSFWQT